MKKFSEWIAGNGDYFPLSGAVSASWFAERGLPMIVECTCCGMTMALPSAYIDEKDYIYCADCAGEE